MRSTGRWTKEYPRAEQVIYRYRVERTVKAGELAFSYLLTNSLCAGKYHIWVVAATRNGNFIEYVKPIYVLNPSCTAELITELGFAAE